MSDGCRSSRSHRGPALGVLFALAAVLGMSGPAVNAAGAAALPAPLLQDVAASTGALAIAFALPGCAPPACAPLNVEYSLDGGLTWTARTPASVASPLDLTGLLDRTTYVLALRAVDGAGAGPASPPVLVTTGMGATTPSGLAISEIVGDEVTLAWDPPAVGAHPGEYLVEGGLAPGQTLATIATGSNATVSRVRLRDGVYYVRVRALALTTTSGASNEVRVMLGAFAPPSAPASLLGLANDAAVALSWTPTFDGGRADQVWLVASGPLSGVVPLGVVETFQYGAVPPGTYQFHVVATNAAGASPPSNTVTLTFPAACAAPPGLPLRLRASAIGQAITFGWNAPDTGTAAVAYRVTVGTPGDRGSAPFGALAGRGPRYVFFVPVAGRHVSGTLPPDFYNLFVSAVNACGIGPMVGPVSIDTR